jgi:hypothetical protein
MSNFIQSMAWVDVLTQVFLFICALSLCKGRPWSVWYLLIGIGFLGHAFLSLEHFHSHTPILMEAINLKNGVPLSTEAIKEINQTTEFWKLVLPVISLGLGCSMIANFLAAKKD